MDLKKRLKISVIGAAVAALCCFTPLLVYALTAVGLASLIGYIDLVMLPAFALLAASAIVAFVRLYIIQK